ncbi:Nitrate/nitrite response regulator protein [Methylophaga frappieri]|uniref:Nitrate/nitrite response regulator protein n=1 Tax=Methylophaga frappieri (strain ATCC BAA-2434 / DSM 25690 / JAM7) TaxID=754477 RepID=I1YK19_METFJ|nr:response regulator transcription factor [Methylophaga frappieri]AFJ03262.1 Nitrate/nitrite response regulator protein [Methylophaga frappieri]
MHAQQSISVLLIDDHTILREGYSQLLEAAGFTIAGQAANAEEGYQAFITKKPTVCIVDLTMPGSGGLECIRRICARDSQANILVCSMHEETSLAMRALELGARGYITKSSSTEVLIEAVKQVAAKQHYLGAGVARSIAIEKLINSDNKINSLSHQEFAVFRMTAEGQSIEEMAANLTLAPKTISNYKTNMMRKLGTTKLADIIFLAQKIGVIHPPHEG